MKKILKTRKFWLVACFMGLVTFGLLAGGKGMSQEKNAEADRDITLINPDQLKGYIHYDIGNGILRIQKK